MPTAFRVAMALCISTLFAGMGANGFTFNDTGTTQRLTQRPADDFNLTQFNYLQVPQERWMLNAFTKNNVPLSSWGTGIELFRRHGNFDFAVAFNYQNMSPPDGNWLGSNADPMTEVNFVHFDHFAMWGFDASFRWYTMFNDWLGLHYGAGFGLGVLSGHIYRSYARNGQCTAATPSRR